MSCLGENIRTNFLFIFFAQAAIYRVLSEVADNMTTNMLSFKNPLITQINNNIIVMLSIPQYHPVTLAITGFRRLTPYLPAC